MDDNLRERRSGIDRRERRFQGFCWHLLSGRRVGERRFGSAVVYQYADLHGSGILLIILAILMMCILDAYLTLSLLNAGAVEINPIMRSAIEGDWQSFFYLKYLLTSVSLIILLMHKNYRILGHISGQQILLAVLALYSLVVSYESALLIRGNVVFLG